MRPLYILVNFAAFLLTVAATQGYILGRLLNRNGERGANAEETNSIHHNMAAARPPADLFDPSVYAKKSQHYTGYKTLKKFGGHSGSRNCFFTPIQCMIEHDLGTYKKMVDSSIKMAAVYKR